MMIWVNPHWCSRFLSSSETNPESRVKGNWVISIPSRWKSALSWVNMKMSQSALFVWCRPCFGQNNRCRGKAIWFISNRAARSKYTLFGLAVGIYDVYTSQTSGIHGARGSTLCIRNLCTNVKTDHRGEGIAQSWVLFLDKRSIKGLCIWSKGVRWVSAII